MSAIVTRRAASRSRSLAWRSAWLGIVASLPLLALGAVCPKPDETAAEAEAGVLASWPADLDRLAGGDPKSRAFVLRHIDASVPASTPFVTRDPLKAFVREEYPLGDDYFIHGKEDTVVFRCVLTNARDGLDGIAVSEISIWGRTGPWEIFRRRANGAFEYDGTRNVRDTSCLESCRTKEYLASGKCTWTRGWPRPAAPGGR